MSSLPAANMAAPSSSKLEQLQEQLDLFNRLAAEELGKGTGRDKDLVAQLQMQAQNVVAQIAQIKQASGEGSVA